MQKKDIKDFTLDELKRDIVKIKAEPYRAKQIFFWIYRKGIDDFGKITNISEQLKEKLCENYYISTIELSRHLKSSDGEAEKFLFKLSDGNFIESVLIYAKNRKTLCLSTQVGCKFACSFCASGFKGFVRDLFPSEIINQLLFVQNNFKHKVTNYVFMGMGEPLDNLENVSKAIIIMNTSQGMGTGARRITVSTCGIIPGINKLKEMGLQINLSISLHASNDRLRDTLMPINKKYPLEELIKACEEYITKTGRMITLEYVLINGINSLLKDADELAVIAKKLKAKVNLIPCSATDSMSFQSPAQKSIDEFINRLTSKKVNATLRESKGGDIQAACGQLALKERE